jgi:hypothetical protein
MSKVTILRFRAWLEVTDYVFSSGRFTVSGYDVIRGSGEVFPITSFSITAGINTIPAATTRIAVGAKALAVTTGGRVGDWSPIHERGTGVEFLLETKSLKYARIIVQDVSPHSETYGEAFTVFEGYVESASQNYSFTATEITVTLRHWLYTLDSHPCISRVTHPLSTSDWKTVLFYMAKTMSTGSNISNVEQTAGTQYSGGTDVRGNIKALLNQLSVFAEKKGITVPDLGKSGSGKPTYDLPLTVDELLRQRFCSRKDGFAPIFPKKFEGGNYRKDLQEAFYKSWSNLSAHSAAMNSLWTMLLEVTGSFGLYVIPTVRNVELIPKWNVPSEEHYQRMEDVIIANSTRLHFRPIAQVVVLPQHFLLHALNVTDPKSGAAGGGENTSAKSNMAIKDYAGVYEAKGSGGTEKGNIFACDAPPWSAYLNGYPVQGENHEGTKSGTDTKSDSKPNTDTKELIGEIEKSRRGFLSAYAESVYWDQIYSSSRMTVISPLRFDICPGATIRIETGGDPRREDNSLKAAFLGLVNSIQFDFDTMDTSATTQYSLAFVRRESPEGTGDKIGMKKHPIFESEKPFINASWIDER